MQLFLDTAEIKIIRELNETGMVDGVTTNPSLIFKSGKNIFEVLKKICTIVDGPVSAEVTALETNKMIEEGLELSKIASNIAIKLPLTWSGLNACKLLTSKGKMVNLTLCFSASQALLAAKSNATFVSPFIGRLDDVNIDGLSLVKDIKQIFTNYQYQTKILSASVRTVNHVTKAALIGSDIATVPPEVFKNLSQHPFTDHGLATFMNDWEKTGQKISS